MPRAIWQGSISFGLVTIPVGLFAAESPERLDLDLLDSRDFSPVGYKKVNKRTGREVASDNLVRGYEVSPGQYVVLENADLKAANAEATQTVDIVGFVSRQDLEPIVYDKPYYLAPRQKGAKAYALLREALRRSEQIGIANVVIRTRAYAAALYPLDEVLVLQLLRYAHEMRETKGLDLPGKPSQLKVTPSEISMAEKLIEGLAMDWKWDAYRDEYRDDLLALIKKKAAGKEPEVVEVPEAAASRGAEVVDLMALLKRSVSDADKKPAPKAAARSRRQTTSRRTKRATASKRRSA